MLNPVEESGVEAEILSEAHATESEGGAELNKLVSSLRRSEFVDGQSEAFPVILSLCSLELMVFLRSHTDVVFVECQPRLNRWKYLGIHTLLLQKERLEMHSSFFRGLK